MSAIVIIVNKALINLFESFITFMMLLLLLMLLLMLLLLMLLLMTLRVHTDNFIKMLHGA